MLVSIFLTVISPYTAFLPALYAVYKVLYKRINICKNPWNIGLFLLFIWSMITGLLNHSGISFLLSFALLIYFCLSVFIENEFDDIGKIEILLKSLVYFSIFPALLGIVEKITFAYFHSTLWKNLLGIASDTTVNHRIYSTFGNPNVAGNWFAVMILVCIYFNSKTSKNTKRFYKLSSILFIVALCLTGSRGADIGLLAGLFTYYFLKKGKKNIRYLIPVLILTAILAFAPSSILSISNLMGHEVDSSFSSRYAIWDGCLEMIKIKPVTGWGLMGIYNHGLDYITYDSKVFHGHNIWITIITMFGIVGLSIYVYMKFYLYKCIKTLYTQNCSLAPLLAGVQVLVLGHGLVDFTIMTPQAGLLFISCSALISSLAAQYSSSLAFKPLTLSRYKTLYYTGHLKNPSLSKNLHSLKH